MGKMSAALTIWLGKTNRPKLNVRNFAAVGQETIAAPYFNAQNLLSCFAEQTIVAPPLHPIHDFISRWQDTYQPSFPPMSPITESYFYGWVLLDASFGPDKETIGTCFLDVVEQIEVSALEIEAVKNLTRSRMGLYEVKRSNGPFVVLSELLTDKEISAHIAAEYQAVIGDLLWLRLLPPLSGDLLHHVALTTPYRSQAATKTDWLAYFKRHQLLPGAPNLEKNLQTHFKYGMSQIYWSEFAFYGYVSHTPSVIDLMGFPDEPQSQPNHPKFKAAFNEKNPSAKKISGSPYSQAQPKTDPKNLLTPLTEVEVEILDEYLTFECTSEEPMMLDQLDGFLIAIAIGPSTIMPQEWMPKIWGHNSMMPPVESLEEMNYLAGLVMRHYNGVISGFEAMPASIAPLWSSREYRGKEYDEADMWCMGFVEGVKLRWADWQPLLKTEQGKQWFRSIDLLTNVDEDPKVRALSATPAKRSKLAQSIPNAVLDMYHYWLPLRLAVYERKVAKTMQTKVGRNDPCPCGSGTKFKKCCGAAANLH